MSASAKAHSGRKLVGRIRKETNPEKHHRWLSLQSGWEIRRVCFRAMTESTEQEGGMRNILKIRKRKEEEGSKTSSTER